MGELYYCGSEGVFLIRKVRTTQYRQVRSSSKFCGWCGCVVHIGRGQLRTKATVDHIVPKCHDGTDSRQNIKLSCDGCNQGRAAAGHCIGTLACIQAIVGPSISEIARYYNQSVIAERAPKGALSVSTASQSLK